MISRSFKAAMRKTSRILSRDTRLTYVIELGAVVVGPPATSKASFSHEVHLYVKHDVASDFLENNQVR
jgi:hypothetical protein